MKRLDGLGIGYFMGFMVGFAVAAILVYCIDHKECFPLQDNPSQVVCYK